MEPLIAVVVPVYNTKPVLPYCIESILGQTYSKLRLIIIDDGSTDGSSEICDLYSKKDKRIKVVHIENNGVSNARNLGIEYANELKCQYISFIDSDDVIDLNYIEFMVNMLIKTNCNIAWVQFKETTIENLKKNLIIRKYPNWDKIKVVRSSKLLKDEHKRVLLSCVWGKLFKLSLFENIAFPKQYYEDGATTYKVIYKSEKIAINNSPLYTVVGMPNSLTRSKLTKEKIQDGIATVIQQRNFYEKNNEPILAKCTYAGLANDILMWYNECCKYQNINVDFDLDVEKEYLTQILKNNKSKMLQAPNIMIIQKLIILMCGVNMKHANLYMKSNKIRIYIDSLINKIHKVYKVILNRR